MLSTNRLVFITLAIAASLTSSQGEEVESRAIVPYASYTYDYIYNADGGLQSGGAGEV